MLTSKAKLLEGYDYADIAWMGGESTITETICLGGFGQAAAVPLQAYQCGTPEAMVEVNSKLYEITHSENPSFRIPFLGYRGTPTGIDIFRVLETGITPAMDLGIAGRDGGQPSDTGHAGLHDPAPPRANPAAGGRIPARPSAVGGTASVC